MSSIRDTKFDSEANMVRLGQSKIRALGKGAGVSFSLRSEVKAPGCIPDVVIFTKDRRDVLYVVSLEFKLSKWKKALAQAFAQKNFCNESYVVIDRACSKGATQNIELFKRFNVGLVSFDKNGVFEVLSYCEPSLPFSVDYSFAFSKELLQRKTVPKELTYTRSVRGGSRLVNVKKVLSRAPRACLGSNHPVF